MTKPFTAEEDAEIVRITECGLANEFWAIALPARRTSEIIERRFELIEQGLCPRPQPL